MLNGKRLDFSKKYNEIKKLISLTKQYSDNNNSNIKKNNYNDNINLIINNKIFTGKEINFSREESKKEKKILFKKNKRKFNFNSYNQKKEQKLSEYRKINERFSKIENNHNNAIEQKIDIMDLEKKAIRFIVHLAVM